MLVGRHINTNHIFHNTPEYAKNLGLEIFQIFLGEPHRVVSKARQIVDMVKFDKELQKHKLSMVIHASYTINLCHPLNTSRFRASQKALVKDLIASSNIGKCLGVIIHMGKNISENDISDADALNNYIQGIKMALKDSPKNTTIILETGASQGSEIASKIEGLTEIYSKLGKEEKLRVKFCVDTCHIWATGYDISGKIGVDKFFKEFGKGIGIDRIACIHFNDSKTALGSCVDRHADLCCGFIGENGLKEVALCAKKYGIPLVMETPLDSIDGKTGRNVTEKDEMERINGWLRR